MSAAHSPPPTALEAALALFSPGRRPAGPTLPDGYLDLLGDADPAGDLPGQRLMQSRGLALIYERLWRPLGGRLLMGLGGPGPAEELRIAMRMLELSDGDRVLDVACGPGNFTREFARAAAGGVVVGLDASPTMLAAAVRAGGEENLLYMRGDAADLPFGEGTFDAICCFAALYLIEQPLSALDEIARVLAPGGRVALLASCNRGLLPAGVADGLVRPLSGVRIFGRDELSSALADRGLVAVEQRVAGFAQFLSARRAPAGG